MWGCVCVVDVPYCVLRPSHNKQSFADFDEYKRLLKEIAVHMDAYTTLIAAVVAPDGDGRLLPGDNVNLRQMWCGIRHECAHVHVHREKCGYVANQPYADPSHADRHLRWRRMNTKIIQQCGE
jgi:hypothetical protein